MNVLFFQKIRLSVTYIFLNFSSVVGDGDPNTSCIFDIWSNSFEPGNNGLKLQGKIININYSLSSFSMHSFQDKKVSIKIMNSSCFYNRY